MQSYECKWQNFHMAQSVMRWEGIPVYSNNFRDLLISYFKLITSRFATKMTWNKITKLVRKRKNVTKSFFSLSLSQVFSVWYWSKQLLSFPSYLSSVSNNDALFVNLDTACEDLTYSKDNIKPCNYSTNTNGIVSSSRMKRKYNCYQLRIHSSSVTQNQYD